MVTPDLGRAPRHALFAFALFLAPSLEDDAKRTPPPPATEEPAPAPPATAPATAPATSGARAPVENEALELGAAPARRAAEGEEPAARVHGVALPAHLAPFGARVRRDALEGALERYARFEELPGGIVFGRAALAPEGAAGPWRLHLDGARIVLVGRDETLELVAERPAVVRAALRFAASERGSDTLIDVDALGEIHLAPELVDTEAGMIAYVADVLPREKLAGTRGSKSLLLDLPARLAARDGRLVVEPALELRFYVPSTEDEPASEPERKRTVRFGGVPLRATGVEGAELPWGAEELRALATELAPAARLAGWIGFFRWARASGVGGLDELASALAAAAPDGTVTPRRVVPGRLR